MFVQLWMTKELVVATKDTTLVEATLLLKQHRIRRLPVVDEEGKLLGILSKEDLINGLPSIIDPLKDDAERVLATQVKVTSLMTADPITLSPADPLEKGARFMRRNKIGGIPVVEDGTLVGIITESDIFQAFMEVMGLEEEGVRVELTIDKTQESFYEVIEILSEKEMGIHAVSLYRNYSEKKQLLTIRMQGDDTEATVDALWSAGFKVNSVSSKEGE